MKVFAICDTELNYAKRLAERMSTEDIFGQVQVFDMPEAVLEYCRDKHIEVLVLAEELFEEYGESFKSAGVFNIFLLTRDKAAGGLKQRYRCFCKYQAASLLIKEMAQAYRQLMSGGNVNSSARQKGTEVIGVFSPVPCVEKTVWALLMGLILAEEKQVLYVNLERYVGFDAILKRRHEADLAEVFYYILHTDEESKGKVVSLFESYRGLTYIPPIRFSEELDGVTEETVVQCVKELADLSAKGEISEKIILLDFNGSTCGHRRLIELCDRLFLTHRNDCITEATIEAFEEEYRAVTGEDLPGKVEKVPLYALKERLSERFFELNEEGELGRAIKKILQKGENI